MTTIKLHNQEEVSGSALNESLATYIKLSQERVIFMSEDVSKTLAAELSALLLYFDNQDPLEPIKLYINSNGGDAAGLSNIYDVMRMIRAPVHTICIGKAYSAGAVILAAGEPGHRSIFPNARVMIHGIQCGFPILGHDVSNSKNYYQFLEENNDNIMKILSHHTGHSLEKVKNDCLRDVWMEAQQAVDYGLVDKIL